MAKGNVICPAFFHRLSPPSSPSLPQVDKLKHIRKQAASRKAQLISASTSPDLSAALRHSSGDSTGRCEGGIGRVTECVWRGELSGGVCVWGGVKEGEGQSGCGGGGRGGKVVCLHVCVYT